MQKAYMLSILLIFSIFLYGSINENQEIKLPINEDNYEMIIDTTGPSCDQDEVFYFNYLKKYNVYKNSDEVIWEIVRSIKKNSYKYENIDLIYSMMWVESRFKYDAKGKGTDSGLLQITKPTYKLLEKRGIIESGKWKNIHNIDHNVDVCMSLISYENDKIKKIFGSEDAIRLLNVYNRGIYKKEEYDYTNKVLKFYNRLQKHKKTAEI